MALCQRVLGLSGSVGERTEQLAAEVGQNESQLEELRALAAEFKKLNQTAANAVEGSACKRHSKKTL